MNATKSRRIAAQALTMLCRERQLGTLAIYFDASDPDRWLIHDYDHVCFTRNNRTVAEVHMKLNQFNGYECNVLIPVIYNLIRKPSEFDPLEHGITPDNRKDIFGSKLRPDIDAILFVENHELLDLPPVKIAKHVGGKKPKVISSLKR